jgi:hypothetical protein
MDSNETALKLAQRRVADSEVRVAQQRAVVAALARLGRDTTQAQALLDTLMEALHLKRERLAYEQAHAASRSSST